MTPKGTILNAVIKSTFLGREDHGIPTCYLHLEHEHGCQGFGGYDLRFYGLDFIDQILETVGVNKWEQLPGKHLRIDESRTKIYGIGNLIKDVWFYPEERGAQKPK